MSLKILFLSHRFYPFIGGIEVNSEILATAFQKAGHTVRMLTWSEDETNKRFPFEITRKPSLIQVWQHHRWADIVYHNNPCLRLAWPSFFVRRRTVIAIRTWIRRNNGEVSLIDKLKLKYLRRANSVIAVSDAVRRKSWPAAKVIPNPYRADVFKSDAGVGGRTDFVFLGRLVSDKGADLAIQAIHELMSSSDLQPVCARETFSLTIIGDGPDRSRLEELADDLQLGSRVTFTGALRGGPLVACLNQHRFILVPSRWEAFGNVALEGMACGCVPIVSGVGGLPEAVGDAGLVFKNGDWKSLAACMRKVLTDNALELRLRVAAADHLANHQPDRIADRYLEVIEDACNGK